MRVVYETNRNLTQEELINESAVLSNRNECKICGKHFSKSALLRRHEAVHTGIKAFECAICQRKYSQKSALQRHVASKHKVTSKTSQVAQESIEKQEDEENIDQLAENVLTALKQLQNGMCTSPKKKVESLSQNCVERTTISDVPSSTQSMPLESRFVLLQDSLNPEHITNIFSTQIARLPRRRFHYVCEYCCKVFLKTYDLIRHRRIHTKENPYKCLQCVKRFKTQTKLNEHKHLHWLRQVNKQQVCHVCDLVFGSVRQLDTHMLLCHKNISYTCDVCSGNFKSLAALKAHKKREEDFDLNRLTQLLPAPGNVTQAKGARLYKCIYCTSTFTRKFNCRSHMRTHLKRLLDNRITKLQQNTKFSRNEYIITDKTSQNSECLELEIIAVPPNTCLYCRKSFQKPSDLKRHLRTHTNEKPFACDVCKKSFALKSTLERHKQTHDPQRKHAVNCQVCGRLYASRTALNVHLRLHTGVRPFKCKTCGQTFRTSGHKLAHIKAGKHDFSKNRLLNV